MTTSSPPRNSSQTPSPSIAPPPEASFATLLRNDYPLIEDRGSGVIVLDGISRDDPIETDIERARVGAYRIFLDRQYRFVNLLNGEQSRAAPDDPRPPLYYGGILDGLRNGALPPSLCGAVFYVEPGALDRFTATIGHYDPDCTRFVRVFPSP